jgi:hypothetical protein
MGTFKEDSVDLGRVKVKVVSNYHGKHSNYSVGFLVYKKPIRRIPYYLDEDGYLWQDVEDMFQMFTMIEGKGLNITWVGKDGTIFSKGMLSR